MHVSFLRIACNLYTQLVTIHATCKVLTMRSRAVFAVLNMLGACAGIVLQELNVWTSVRTLVLGPAVVIVLPIVCATDPLRTRLTRCAILMASTFVSVYLAGTITVALGAASDQLPMSGAGTAEAVICFVMLIIMHTCIMEWTAYALGSPDHERDGALGLPATVLLFWSYALNTIVSYQLLSPNQLSIVPAVLMLLYFILELILSLSILSSARTMARIQREATNRTLSDQQSAQIRTEVETSLRMSKGMKLLRHDLANQVLAIGELARSGRTEEANQTLADLETRARLLADDSRAPAEGIHA